MRPDTKERIGYTHYTSADAFVQRRLDRYMLRSGGGLTPIGRGGYTGGYGGSVPPLTSIASGGATNYIVMNTLTGSPSTNVDFGAVSVVSGSALSWASGAPDTITITRRGVYVLTFTVNGTSSAADGTPQRFICSVPSGWPFSFTVDELTGVVKSGNFYIGNSLVFIATAATTLKIAWNGADDPSGAISQGTLVVSNII